MQSFSRGIFFFFGPTKLVQPLKSYGQSKIEKGKYVTAQKAWITITPRVPPEALKITCTANGG